MSKGPKALSVFNILSHLLKCVLVFVQLCSQFWLGNTASLVGNHDPPAPLEEGQEMVNYRLLRQHWSQIMKHAYGFLKLLRSARRQERLEQRNQRLLSEELSRAAVPNLFGTRDWVCSDSLHRPGAWTWLWMIQALLLPLISDRRYLVHGPEVGDLCCRHSSLGLVWSEDMTKQRKKGAHPGTPVEGQDNLQKDRTNTRLILDFLCNPGIFSFFFLSENIPFHFKGMALDTSCDAFEWWGQRRL